MPELILITLVKDLLKCIHVVDQYFIVNIHEFTLLLWEYSL